MKSKAPRGTKDVLPADIHKWHFIENMFESLCHVYGYEEIRTPIFEDVDVFIRSVGEESDVVTKEMYTFTDRGGRFLALRPECTAGVSRAYVEHGFQNLPQPLKLYYMGPMFRYDRPQAGRQRQFYQMGIEIFGTTDPGSDVEVIKYTWDFFQKIGFTRLELHLNSVGCPACRPPYLEHLKTTFQPRASALCGDCRKRLETNPLRILDCKSPACRDVLADLPGIENSLCQPCRTHFEEVKRILGWLEIDYILDPYLVRGLDYYTQTAFEFVSTKLGAQSSLGGGGRYDNLVEIIGRHRTPGVGMAVGVERILLAMEKEGIALPETQPAGVYIAAESAAMQIEGMKLLYQMRNAGIRAETDYMNRSLKARMKNAHRGSFRYVVILDGDAENKGRWKIRDMVNGEQQEYSPEEAVNVLLENRTDD